MTHTDGIVRKQDDFKVAIEKAVGHGWSIIDAVEQLAIFLLNHDGRWLLYKERICYEGFTELEK
jgi:hypothetical protein